MSTEEGLEEIRERVKALNLGPVTEARRRTALSELREAYEASKPFISNAVATYDDAEDFIRSCRMMMKSSGAEGTDMYVKGFTSLLDYIGTLKRIAQSYHKAVGNAIQQERL